MSDSAHPHGTPSERHDGLPERVLPDRPQFGEYASYEEQQRRRGVTDTPRLSGVSATSAVSLGEVARGHRLNNGVLAGKGGDTTLTGAQPGGFVPATLPGLAHRAHERGHTTPVHIPDAPTPAPSRGRDASAQAEPLAPAARMDRVLTIALLAFGVVNVMMTIVVYQDVPALMDQSMQLMGLSGEFTNYAQGRTWGLIASAVLIAGWTFTALFSAQRLRKRRRAWWIPVLGAVVTMLVASSCLTVPIMNDPAFQAVMNGELPIGG